MSAPRREGRAAAAGRLARGRGRRRAARRAARARRAPSREPSLAFALSRLTQEAVGATPDGRLPRRRAPGLRRADGRADRRAREERRAKATSRRCSHAATPGRSSAPSVVTAYDADAFDAYEASGWESVASEYEEHWSSITGRVIDPLLDAAGVERGARVVDLGTGSGDAAGGAVARGAIATGVDVAAAMVEMLHDGTRPRSSSKPRRRGCRSPTDRSTQPSATLSSSTSASPSERRSSLRECSSQAAASRCRRGSAGALAVLRDDPRSSRRRERSSTHGHSGRPVVLPVRGRCGLRSSPEDAGFTDVEVDAISFEVPLRSAEERI